MKRVKKTAAAPAVRQGVEQHRDERNRELEEKFGWVSIAYISWESLSNGSYNGTEYKGVALLSNSEKEKIIGVTKTGSFVYRVDGYNRMTEEDKLIPEEISRFLSPMSFTVCPLTGLSFVKPGTELLEEESTQEGVNNECYI